MPETEEKPVSECERKNKWWRGCLFEARYDYGELNYSVKQNAASADETCKIIKAMRPKTYVRDVCIRCGKTIERNK